jgi:hypothetical protein
MLGQGARRDREQQYALFHQQRVSVENPEQEYSDTPDTPCPLKPLILPNTRPRGVVGFKTLVSTSSIHVVRSMRSIDFGRMGDCRHTEFCILIVAEMNLVSYVLSGQWFQGKRSGSSRRLAEESPL